MPGQNCFAAYCASPLTRYIPLSKNIEFHKMVAGGIAFHAILHTLAHFFNYWSAQRITLKQFSNWGTSVR